MFLPLREIKTGLNRIASGKLDTKLPICNARLNELDQIKLQFNSMSAQLVGAQQESVRIHQHLEHLVQERTQGLEEANQSLNLIANTDALTQLSNRRAFDQLRDLMLRDEILASSIAVVLIDLDFFKTVNDNYGHAAGDHLLHLMANTVKATGEELLFRLGADEFVIVLLDQPLDTAIHMAQHIHQQYTNIPQQEHHIGETLKVSVGVAHQHVSKSSEGVNLMRMADMAMYEAKHNLHEKVVVYDAKKHTQDPGLVNHQAATVLMKAIEGGDELHLQFQPIYAVGDKAISYYEVLSRLKQDDGCLSPGVFMPIVHRANMQLDFDLAVIAKVNQCLHEAKLPANTGLAINLSAEFFVHKNVVAHLRPLKQHLKQHKIILELTETSLIQRLDTVRSVIKTLRNQGFLIALDDFGSGYSSISYLTNLPVDIVKFDITIAKATCEHPYTEKMIHNLILQLNDLGYASVVEGIEDEAMFDYFHKMNVTHLQGYHIGRPASIEDLPLTPCP